MNESELFMRWSRMLGCLSLAWPLKLLCWNSLGSSDCWITRHSFLHGPAIKLYLLWNSSIWFLWPHCAFRHTNFCMVTLGLPRWHGSKESACQCRRHKTCRFNPWIGKIPWGRTWQPAPAFLPGKFHGQGSLLGYSPWGHKELNTTDKEREIPIQGIGFF